MTSTSIVAKSEPGTWTHSRDTSGPAQAGQCINIYAKSDVIVARAAVRRFASEQGCDAMTQIAISVATWLLARTLQLGGLYQGQILIDRVGCGQDGVVRVVCICPATTGRVILREALNESRQLVDDLVLEMLPPDKVRVTLLKKVNG